MISRRNIRIKVMQTLYTLETQQVDPDNEAAQALLRKHFDQTGQLFCALIYHLVEIARYAETDARLRASKHLPSSADLAVNTKIAGNELLWQIIELPAYLESVRIFKTELLTDPENIRRLYGKLTETDIYQTYIQQDSRDKKEEKKILEYVFTDVMLTDESFLSYLEENFIHWDDDAEMLIQMVLNFLGKPGAYHPLSLVGPEKLEFGQKLLATTIDKKEYCLELIRPKLKNWDADRIAQLDMILMRMGVSELLYFETIPTKVTINEYIDIAKDYSTPQSGQFVNGLLDGIHKDLEGAGRLKKVDYRKQP